MTADTTKEAQLLGIIRTQNEIAASDLDLEQALQVISDRAQELTGAEGAGIHTLDGVDGFVLRVGSGNCESFVGAQVSRETTLTGRALYERRALESVDCANDLRVDREVSAEMGVGSTICVPLFHRDEAIGVLTVVHSEPHHFTPTDRQALELMSDLMAAQVAHASLYAAEAHRGRHDALTGLANRRAYEERLNKEVARAQRYKHPLSLCVFDLDGFKAINDEHGHPAGDEILRKVADVVRHLRLGDEGFRIGGDEFALLLPETPADQAEIAVRRLVDAIGLIKAPAGAAAIGVSFGIASGHTDAKALHAAADNRLIAAKAELYSRGDAARPSSFAA